MEEVVTQREAEPKMPTTGIAHILEKHSLIDEVSLSAENNYALDAILPKNEHGVRQLEDFFRVIDNNYFLEAQKKSEFKNDKHMKVERHIKTVQRLKTLSKISRLKRKNYDSSIRFQDLKDAIS